MRNRTEDQIEFILIRHGETRSNEEHRYLGTGDEGLSENGRRKLLQLKEKKYNRNIILCGKAENKMDLEVDVVFSSPMKRCLESAQILFGTDETRAFQGTFVPVVIPEWREMDFGDFEGKNYQELSGNADYQAWIDSNGTLPFPNGESREEFTARCVGGFRRMLKILRQDLAAAEQNRKTGCIAAVVHGGTIMALLSSLYGGEYFDYQVKNGEGYSCMVDITEPCRILEIRKL